MKFQRHIYICLCFLFLTNLKAQQSDNEPVVLDQYNLKQCIEYALKNSNTIKNAKLDIQLAKAKITETASSGLPQVNASLNLLHSYKVPKSFLPAQLVDPRASKGEFTAVEFQPAFNGQASFTVNQLLFDGTYFTALKASKVYKKLSVRQLEMTKNDVIANVSQAYYMVLINQERQTLIDANIARLENLHKETKAIYENGMVEKLDVDRILVTLNSLKAQKQKLLMAVGLSVEFLKFQMGLQITDKITVGEKISDLQLESPQDLQNVANQKMEYSKRPEFQLLQVQKELNHLNIKRYQSGYYPSISLFADYGWSSGAKDFKKYIDLKNYWFGNGKYGLAFRFPIFDGLRKKALIQQSKLDLQKTQNNISELKRSINLQVTQAAYNLQANLQILEARKQNLNLAKEVYRITKIKYREGVGSNLEILEAENALKQAETDYYVVLYDALLTQLDLKKALGILGK